MDYEEGEEEDEIVQEIDVYLSPRLCSSIRLIQFPLVPRGSGVRKRGMALSASQPLEARFKPQHGMLELDVPLPTSFRDRESNKPQQHRTYGSSNIAPCTHLALAYWEKKAPRKKVAKPTLRHRRHVLEDDDDDDLGKQDEKDETGAPIRDALHVIPVVNDILQMRPSYQHIDALYEDDDDAEQAAMAAKLKAQKEGQQPVLLKKKESDRAAAFRKSSYAYFKASRDAEDWKHLSVHTEKSTNAKSHDAPTTNTRTEFSKTMRRVRCHEVDMLHILDKRAIISPTASGNATYVHSLNYLPGTDTLDLDTSMPAAAAPLSTALDEPKDNDNNQPQAEQRAQNEALVRDVTHRVTTLLQKGVPIPYVLLQQRFLPNTAANATLKETHLIQALLACSILVRGNFLLKSSLCGLTKVGQDIRDVTCLLLNKYGYVQKYALQQILQLMPLRQDHDNDDSDDDDVVTTKKKKKKPRNPKDRPLPPSQELLHAILSKIAFCQRLESGGGGGRGPSLLANVSDAPNAGGYWELKMEDDDDFVADHPEFALRQKRWWEKRGKQLKELVEAYDEICFGDDDEDQEQEGEEEEEQDEDTEEMQVDQVEV